MTGLRILIPVAVAALLGGSPVLAGSYRLMFDMFSPRGITCNAQLPEGGSVHQSRGITGNPVIRLTGDIRHATIRCTLPDGSRWEAVAQQALSPGAWATDAVVAAREGAEATMTILSRGQRPRSEVVPRSFRRIH